MERFPDIEVIVGVHTDFDRVKRRSTPRRTFLAAHDDIDLIYGVSTAVGLGAGQAVRQAGQSDEIMTIGAFGGTGDEVTAMEEGWLSASADALHRRQRRRSGGTLSCST